jgi:hypothetical protein
MEFVGYIVVLTMTSMTGRSKEGCCRAWQYHMETKLRVAGVRQNVETDTLCMNYKGVGFNPHPFLFTERFRF